MTDAVPSSKKGSPLPKVVLMALLASLGLHEGRRYVTYYDQANVLTVCDGITGKGVIKDKKYTDAECDALLMDRVVEVDTKVMSCLKVEPSMTQRFAYDHFAFNTGAPAFCASTMVRKHNARDFKGACQEFARWRFVAGKDCATSGRFCPGIVVRRAFEAAACEGRVDLEKLAGWK
jgi:lysozyme